MNDGEICDSKSRIQDIMSKIKDREAGNGNIEISHKKFTSKLFNEFIQKGFSDVFRS